MAESERLRGNKSPVTNYKVGDGSVKDLFKYIMGDDLEVKKIKPKKKQTKVAKKDKQFVRDFITSAVGTATSNISNETSLMAGERAQGIQDDMSASMMQQDPMMGMQEPVMQQDPMGGMQGPMVESPGRVDVTNLPETGMLPPEEQLDQRLQELSAQGGVLDSGQTYRMGMNRPNTPMENPAGTFGGELLRPQGMGQEMYGGGRVMQKKKKKKKKLAGGGKVTSYNY